MSTVLNISTSSRSASNKPKFQAKPKGVPVLSNDLNFAFSKAKVKAIAVRRKAPPNRKIEEPAVKVKEKPPPKEESPPRKNYVSAPKYSDGEDSDVNKDSGVELSLNVCQGSIEPKQIKKRMPTRDERRNSKKNQAKINANRVLTQEEINEGIKKFSEPSGEKRFPKKDRPFKKHALVIPETQLIGQRAVKPVTEKIFTGTSMDSVGLHPHCVKNLADVLNITELTTVQLKTVPKALEGRDILVRSQTGSGKTLAYALPVVQKIQEIRPKLTRTCGIRAVVIVPTRELAIQTYEIFIKLLKPFTWVVPGYLTGGEKRKSEKARLRKGVNILIGTPGRLVDHLLNTASLKLDKTQFLILDEGDRLFEMSYERDVQKIVEGINDHIAGKFTADEEDDKPKKNPFSNTKTEEEKTEGGEKEQSNIKPQTMILSATLTAAVQRLAGLALKDPLFIDTSDDEVPFAARNNQDLITSVTDTSDEAKMSIPSTIDLRYIVVPPKLRLVTLSGMLATAAVAAKGSLKALVFMSTIEMVEYHHNLLAECLTDKVLDEDEEEREDEGSDTDSDEDALLKGVTIFRLHGSMNQNERSGVFDAFRKCKQGILLATDVVGRGIDIIEVNLVVQYTPPPNIAEFVHHLGRTARAGRSGEAILFLCPNETDFVRRLEEKRIRISQDDLERYLKILRTNDDAAHTTQEAASNLQHKFEELVDEDREIHAKAHKAFVSWIRLYSSFPKDLKGIFNVKSAHMGHFAKSFALKEPPKSFVKNAYTPKSPLPTNRLTYTERDPQKLKEEMKNRKRTHHDERKTNQLTNRFNKYLQNSLALTISEYDSGLAPLKKKKKK